MYGYNMERGLNTVTNRLDSAVGTIRSQAGQGIGGQIEERPWLTLGAALAAGFVLGSLLGGDSDDRSSYRQDWGEHTQRSYPNTNSYTSDPATISHYREQQDITAKTQQFGNSYGGPSNYGTQGKQEHGLPSTSYSANTGASNTTASAARPPAQPKQPGPIATKVNEQVDTVVSMAGEVVRNFLRDTIRDAVPSMRDQVNALDRRDGRTPQQPVSRSSSARLYEVDDAATRTSDPSLT